MPIDLLQSLLTALFIGALVGTERTHHQLDGPEGFGGLRTFVLVAELGAICAWLTRTLQSPAVLVAGFIAVGGFIGVVYFVERTRAGEQPGTTTEVAALVVYVLGAVAVLNEPLAAVALAIVTAALLALKGKLHRAVERVSRAELLATLRLLFASFVVLPLLPREPIDPWGVINPFKLWLLVVLISALSMVGYIAVRVYGAARGTLLTGFFGGLVSSTAATLTLAKRSREDDAPIEALASATLIAWTVMFLRIIVIVGALSWSLLPPVALILGGMGAAALASGFLALYRAPAVPGGDTHRLDLENPFRLRAAVQFALLFAAVLVASRLAQTYFPGVGLYGVSAIAGSTDADAVALTLLEVHSRGEAAASIVVTGMVIAAVANTWVKLLLTLLLGDRGLFWRLLFPTILISVIGGILAFRL